MKLVDVPDSKSGVGNYVPVRPRPSAFLNDLSRLRVFSEGLHIPRKVFVLYQEHLCKKPLFCGVFLL